MLDTIEKLRQKPDRKKKQIAFFFSFLLSGLVFVVWLTIIYPDFMNKQSRDVEVSKMEPTPIEGLVNIVSGASTNIGDQLNRIKGVVNSYSSNETYYVASSTDSVYPETTVEVATSTEDGI
ncbi:MAG: hypothetical protein ABL917_01310 [Parcubacteria group bacterium]